MRPRHRTKYPGIYYRLLDEEKPNGDRRYIVWYSDVNGDGHTETLPLEANLEDARRRQAQLNERKAGGETLVRTKMTVGELLDRWLETRERSIAEKTYRDYRWGIGHLKDGFGRCKVAELSPTDVATLIANLEKQGMKAASIRKVLAPLTGAFKVAVRDGLVGSSPVSKLLPHERPKGRQREMRILPREDIGKLLNATQSARWKALFALLTFTGLRIGEAAHLTWDDVVGEYLSVRQSKTPAGIRDVVLIPYVSELLEAWRREQVPGAQFVFGARWGEPLQRTSALSALHRACKDAGLERHTLHELRHTFASILIAQGELPTYVAEQMGHADPAITLRVYVKLWKAQESREEARKRLQALAEEVTE